MPLSTIDRIDRKSFGKVAPVIDIPNLLDVQLRSFGAFLQADTVPKERRRQGLQAVFEAIFPVTDVHEIYSLEFVEYNIGRPRYEVWECQERDMTYSASLRATLRLVVHDPDSKTREVKDVIEQSVYLGELPLMTQNGTFVINGSERVIVSQLHRSPGVFFDETIHPNGKRLFSARVIPSLGAWLEFAIDINDVLYAYIDRKRKLPVTVLLRAMGYPTNTDILDTFRELTTETVGPELVGKWLARDTADLTAPQALTPEAVEALTEGGIKSVEVYASEDTDDAFVMENTLKRDTTTSEEEALCRIYNVLRPGDPPNVETARQLLDRLFFNPKRYDLGAVGRFRMNQRLQLGLGMEQTTLVAEDFVAIVLYVLLLRGGGGYTDDIDHLGNRRTRTVGELLGNQFSTGLSRMARIIRERMSLRDAESITPQELVNARTVSTVIASFFGSSQLSQFMDQINPLAELTHKRRLSALGPGGLTRDRAGFEVRDVHYTHYGRLCPIETPEGANIGLISSLAAHTRVNAFGFLETPYRCVENGRVTDRVEYLTADQEDRYVIAQANAPLNPDGAFANETVQARHRGDFPVVRPGEVQYMDVSPMQLVSAAAALIPFLEHDDANRALMGSNMQRQAVPVLKTDAPRVGTGLEGRIAVDSGAVVTARSDGVVVYVSSDKIVIEAEITSNGAPDLLGLGRVQNYHLTKFRRTNNDTCVNQRPIVSVGDRVTAGQPIADGPATDRGDLALGGNVLVAFVPWYGYNFEDAIVVSEGLLKRDGFTSLHIEGFQLQVRDTKRGPEELTPEIPNVSEEAVRNLNEQGIIRTGAEVKPRDILVGKVTPKGETELSAEERLLRAIFGEKAGDVRDAALYAPPGMDGIVIDTRLFSRKGRDAEARQQEEERVKTLQAEAGSEIGRIKDARDRKLAELFEERGLKFHPLDEVNGDGFEGDDGERRWTDDEKLNDEVKRIMSFTDELVDATRERLGREIEKLQRGDELSPGVIQLVKVGIARKRRLQVGDKMAGRHGNKGVVARVVPEEDMPFLPDGTPVDVVLNPLGVPARMNLGQVLETHMGWAAKLLNEYTATPVFEGASLEEVKAELRGAGLPESGQVTLYDGRTGDPFEKPATVGYIYLMKLHHLVSDKIHSRSIGPYSLVTQQPLGGKAQFGGQRFGEMEVWALEAYGAAYLLREMLTVKSDDVQGRSRIYEAIVKGDNTPDPGIPESFNVLVKELQSLGLDVRLLKDGEEEVPLPVLPEVLRAEVEEEMA